MKKNLLLVIISLFLLFNFPLGILANNQQRLIEITLKEAIDLSLKGNHSYLLAKLDLDQAGAELARSKLVNDQEMLEQAQKKWDEQHQNYQEQVRKLISDVQNKYYELLQQEATVSNQAGALERANSQLSVDQAKYQAGIIASLDIMRSENSVLTANNNYDNASITLETKYLEFNQLLGLSLDTKLVLIDQVIIDFVPFELELDYSYKMALKHDPSISQAKESLAEAIDRIDATDNPFTPRADFENALINHEKAEIRLEQAKQNLYFKIRSDFYSLKNAEKNVLTKERELKLEEQLLQAEQVKYDAGVVSNESIVNQQEKLAQTENAFTEAIWSYSQAQNNFLSKIGLQEPLWEAKSND